jgi:hypothetical protein
MSENFVAESVQIFRYVVCCFTLLRDGWVERSLRQGGPPQAPLLETANRPHGVLGRQF